METPSAPLVAEGRTRPLAVGIVDHVRAHRDGVVLAVEATADLEVAVAVDRPADLSDADLRGLDALLLQAAAPGALDVEVTLARVRSLAPAVRVVIGLWWANADLVRWARAVGADAVVTPSSPLSTTVGALRAGVVEDVTVEDRAVAAAAHRAVTETELDVLWRLSDGSPPQRIAHDLGRSVATIRDHLRSLRVKLDCQTAVELVVTAHRLGLVPALGRPPTSPPLTAAPTRWPSGAGPAEPAGPA